MTVTAKTKGLRKRLPAGSMKLDANGEGTFSCKLATFEVVDHDGDYTLPTAFDHMNGKDIVVCDWGHAWGEKNIGRGTLRVEAGDGLYLDGHFYTNTTHGMDAYQTVKGNAELQEWSYGYDVNDQEPMTLGGARVNGLKMVTPFEGSPVLRGAGIGTGTVAIKGEPCPTCGMKPDAAKESADDEDPDSAGAKDDDTCPDCDKAIHDCTCGAGDGGDGGKSGDMEGASAKWRAAIAVASFEVNRAKTSPVWDGIALDAPDVETTPNDSQPD